MSFLSFYTLKGFELDYLLNLSPAGKTFYLATKELEEEEYQKLGGGFNNG